MFLLQKYFMTGWLFSKNEQKLYLINNTKKTMFFYRHCGLDPQSPQSIVNVRGYRIKCGMTVKEK
jgi:hypothetical protein